MYRYQTTPSGQYELWYQEDKLAEMKQVSLLIETFGPLPHGDPEKVQKYMDTVRFKLREQKAGFDLIETWKIYTGTWKVDELNRLIESATYWPLFAKAHGISTEDTGNLG